MNLETDTANSARMEGNNKMAWNKPYNPPKNQRLDRELYCSPDRITFVTLCVHERKQAFIRPEFNQLILDELQAQQEKNDCRVYTYCLMPDHIHFLARPEIAGISVLAFTDRFKGRSTNQSWTVDWQGKLWQRRSWDHIVRAEESLLAIAQYILNNPVRKGLVNRAEDWPWSGHMNPLPL